MGRSQGFARGDLDTAFPLDDKFIDLRARVTPERYRCGTMTSATGWMASVATLRPALLHLERLRPMADGRYCKVYHVLAAEYPRVFEDDRTLGCYVRLLMLADAAWPLRPYLPARIDRRALAILTAEGLVMLQDTGRYSILGLDKERAVRRQNASAAAKARYADGSADRSAPGNAIRNAETLPTRSRAEAEAEGVRGAKPLDARDPSDLSTRRER